MAANDTEALRALAGAWRNRAATLAPGMGARIAYQICADELVATLTPAPAAMGREAEVEQAIQRAAFECALYAYGYWRGDSSGSADARRYFREGYIGRDGDVATYAGMIRHFITPALAPRAEAVAPAPAVKAGIALEALRVLSGSAMPDGTLIPDAIGIYAYRERQKAQDAALASQPPADAVTDAPITRYGVRHTRRYGTGIEPSPTGPYVRYEDHVAALHASQKESPNVSA